MNSHDLHGEEMAHIMQTELNRLLRESGSGTTLDLAGFEKMKRALADLSPADMTTTAGRTGDMARAAADAVAKEEAIRRSNEHLTAEREKAIAAQSERDGERQKYIEEALF